MTLLSYGRAMGLLAERDPDAVAVVYEERRASRGQLERRSNRLARAYAELAVHEGDLVTIALPNGIEFFEVTMAIWKLGATPQPVSHHLPDLERRAIVETADPALVVGVAEGDYGDRSCLPAGFEPDDRISEAPLPDRLPACVRAMSSGGSTGRPKIIVEKSPAECDPEAAQGLIQPRTAVLAPGPLYHAGPFICLWQAVLCGGTAITMTRFDAEEALALIERQAVDYALFVPTMMQRIWRLPDEIRTRYDLSSLRSVMASGAPSPAWLKRAWIEWLGPERIFEAYGGSERIGGTQITGNEWLEHPGSVGRPTGGRKLEILDPQGRRLPPGEIGEVFMMPPGGQGSTYRYIGAEARASADGWETLGDMGYVDEEGYLYLVDRKTDMIVTGGANVYPAEVEAAIDAHPAVRSSAVIGLPDDDLGQRVHALVDAPGGANEDAMREHLAGHLVRYKIPRSFEFVDEPLRDDAGKVRRSALREARAARPDESNRDTATSGVREEE